MDTTNNGTFEIPAYRLPYFEERMAKLVSKAHKLGCPSAGYEIVSHFEREVHVETYDGSYKKRVPYARVRVFGEAPKYAGWSLVGRLDFASVPGATVRAMVPGHTCPTEFYEVAPGRCDHCHTTRRRNDSFLLQHEDGRIVVVGRQCIADFLGGQSPEGIASLAETLVEMGSSGDDDEGGGGGGRRGFDGYETAEFMAVTAFVVRAFGWVARSAMTDAPSTAGVVAELLTPQRDAARERERRETLARVSCKDGERATAALAWIAANTEISDYMHNLRAVCGAPSVALRMTGIAASLIVAWDRAMARDAHRAAEKAAKKPSTHQGKVGEKLAFTGEVVMVRGCDGHYGTTTIVKLVDDTGNVFTWFASGEKDLARGERYAVKGTVKKHETYNGEPQTVMTRCKLAALPATAPVAAPAAAPRAVHRSPGYDYDYGARRDRDRGPGYDYEGAILAEQEDDGRNVG